MQPHVCPKCHGERIVTEAMYPAATTTHVQTRLCPTCTGEGVVWELETTEKVVRVRHRPGDKLEKEK
jgi:hypothetical protein